MKTLFEVEVSDHVYVMAQNENDAERIAKSNQDTMSLDFYASRACLCYAQWENLHPLNSDEDDNRTVGEILKELRAEQEKKQYMDKHYRELPFNFKKGGFT